VSNSHLRRCIDCGQVKSKEHDFPAVNDPRQTQPRYLRRCWACYRRILRRIDIRARIRELRVRGLTPGLGSVRARGGVPSTEEGCAAAVRLTERGGGLRGFGA